MIFNPRGLDGDGIVAHWMDHAHKAMVRYFPDYTPVRLVTDKAGVLVWAPAISSTARGLIAVLVAQVCRAITIQLCSADPEIPDSRDRIKRAGIEVLKECAEYNRAASDVRSVFFIPIA